MNTRNIALASALALAALTGSAFAQSQRPIAGDAPLVPDGGSIVSTESHTQEMRDMEKEAAQMGHSVGQHTVSGNVSQAEAPMKSQTTRAQVEGSLEQEAAKMGHSVGQHVPKGNEE